MTAASYTSRAFAATGRTNVRWQRALALLGICLPVPICAASGLTLPLPATVERIAASLVPWLDAGTMSANEALRAGVRGAILVDPDERSQNGVAQSRFATVATQHGSTSDTTRVVIPRPGDPYAWPEFRDEPVPPVPAHPAGAPDAEGRAEPVGNAGGAPSGSAEGSDPAPAPPATTPSEPAPTQPDPIVEPVVEDVIAPVKPVIDEVLAPTAPVIEETTKIVDEPIAPVTGPLPGLGN
jgi:hypothetical protein